MNGLVSIFMGKMQIIWHQGKNKLDGSYIFKQQKRFGVEKNKLLRKISLTGGFFE